MENKREINQQYLTGERALFQARNAKITVSTFADGESPLKESADIELYQCMFRWKYPLWYSRNITLTDCTLFNTARAGIWYTDDLSMENCAVEAHKTFRRCHRLELRNVTMPDAAETLWSCEDVKLRSVMAKGDYFGMNSRNIEAEGFQLYGNYPFDGGRNIVIRNSRLLSKDAFWNCRNVEICDSFISGEYLGWNSENLTFVNCTIESLQGLCYAKNVTLRNCVLLNTTLAFEYSTVDAEINGSIDSVKNPIYGRITADSIGELIMEPDKADPSRTVIECRSDRQCACV
mgnify:FL=1